MHNSLRHRCTKKALHLCDWGAQRSGAVYDGELAHWNPILVLTVACQIEEKTQVTLTPSPAPSPFPLHGDVLSLMGMTGIFLLTVGISAMLWVSPDRGASTPRPAVSCLREKWGPYHRGLTGHFVHRMGLILQYTSVGLLKWDAAKCWTVKPSFVLWFPQWHYHRGKIFAAFILPEEILYLQLDLGS